MQTLRPGRRLQLCKHGAPTRCMFSVLKAFDKQVGSHQKKKRPVFDMYATAVTSFVESYIAANQKYPSISEVMRSTGGRRTTIRRIICELNVGKNVARSKEVCVKGQDSTKEMHTLHSRSKCMPSTIINVEDSALSCFGKFEEPAEEADSAQVEALVDSADAELENEMTSVSAPDIERKGFSVLRDPALLALLNEAKHSSNKTEANRRVAPLMEVLQQKSSGSSRRVHLSDCREIDNGLSWEKTLQSIMPTSVGGMEDRSGLEDTQLKASRSVMPTSVCGKEESSGLKDKHTKVERGDMVQQLKVKQPKVNRENMGHISLSSGDCKETFGTVSNSEFIVEVISLKINLSPKVKSVLSYIPGDQFKLALNQQAEVFKDVYAVQFFRRNTNVLAALRFKNYKSMKAALELKNVIIGGELLRLQKHNTPAVGSTREDASQAAASSDSSVFQEVMEGMSGSLKKEDLSSKVLHSSCYPCVENKQSYVCVQGPHPSFLQTISIQKCPSTIPLKSISSFFSVFGKVQTSYRAFDHGSAGTQILVEFENESDKEKAIKVQQFLVDGCSFQLRPRCSSLVIKPKPERLEFPEVQKAVARLFYQHNVQKFNWNGSQIVDLTFRVNEEHRINDLLKSLCEDTCLKGKWEFLPLYEGYIQAECVPSLYTENLRNVSVLLNEISTYITSLLRKNG